MTARYLITDPCYASHHQKQDNEGYKVSEGAHCKLTKIKAVMKV